MRVSVIGASFGIGMSGYVWAAPPDAGSAPPTPAQESAVQPTAGASAQPAALGGVEIETRGPVHEAFAEPVVFDPTPGVIAPKAPPKDIDETPSDQRLEGDDVAWIPGYWAWDDDRSDFIWVTGIWRNMPPGRQWVPGYWQEVDNGYQWVSGFWQSDRVQTMQYLPEPPETLEAGPVGQPQQPDSIWVPGVWLYRADNYVWRPGYWLAPQDNWVWVPAHYCWAPSGYVFLSGYWDYAIPQRGVLFAPAYFPQAVYSRPGFVYTPSIVVNSGVLVGNLFARPRYNHYYFGDYYDRGYVQKGIFPAFAFHDSRYGYDPILASYTARHRDYFQRAREDYRYLRDHPDVRPPHTFSAFQTWSANNRVRDNARLAGLASLALPLNRAVQSNIFSSMKFTNVQANQLNTYRQNINQARQYQAQRRNVESQHRIMGTPVGPTPENRANISKELQQNLSQQQQQRNLTPEQRAQERQRFTQQQQRHLTPEQQAQERQRFTQEQQQREQQSRTEQQRQQQNRAEQQRERSDLHRRSESNRENLQRQTDSGQGARSMQQGERERAARQPIRVPMQKSPLSGRSLNQMQKQSAPPARPKASKPDTNAKQGSHSGTRREPKVD